MASDPPTLRQAAAWPPTARRGRLLAPLAAILASLLLAAWAVPPLLDWSRFRTAIAAIAARNLGRPVVIGGEVRLRLLPEAVLTASDVTLADQGDGISGQVATLRLQAAMLPLLAGRLALRDLVLSAPVLRLPMRLPDALAHPSRPEVPHAFAARVEDGTLRIGQVRITGINAAVHGGPATGTLREVLSPDAAPVAAFGAEGFAAVGGRTWRFTGALGAPDADGVSAVDLAVHGQGAAGSTGGTIQGTLTDGLVQGRLRASGPDLSLLMPASPSPWTADAPFVAGVDRVDASAISLSLGGAPADGVLSLTLTAPARLDGRLHAASVDLDGWVALLGRSFAHGAGRDDSGAGDFGARDTGVRDTGVRDSGVRDSGVRDSDGRDLGAREPGMRDSGVRALPVRIQLAADTATLLGGTLVHPHATLVSQAGQVRLDDAEAMLPGAATLRTRSARFALAGDGGLTLAGAAATTGGHSALPAASSGGLSLSGDTALDAPDLPATLAWLRPLAPSLADAAHFADAALSAGPHAARLAGTLTLTGTGASVSGLSGQVYGTALSGSGAVVLGRRPRVEATLALDQLGLAFWDAAVARWWGQAGTATQLAFDSGVHLTAAHATWRGATLDDLALDAATDAGALRIDRAQASLAGALLSLSGTATPDGRVSARASAGTADAARLLAAFPASWRWAPGLWRGPASVRLAADGPAKALGLQLRADVDDMVLETDALWNRRSFTSEATLTVRHPGAPRLLADLGILAALGEPEPGNAAASWLDTGALTLRAHLHTTKQQARLDDFELDAAALRLSGQLQEDWSGSAPLLSGRLDADVLALPDTLPQAARLATLAAGAAQLHLSARRVTLGLRPLGTGLSADLFLGSGMLLAEDVTAEVADGRLVGQVAADLTRPAAATRLQLRGATLAGPLTAWPIDLVAGKADLYASLDDDGPGWASLSGSAHAALAGGQVSGFNLANFRQAAGLHTRLARGAADAALAQGQSPGLSGTLDATFDHGRLAVAPSVLTSADGTVSLSGTVGAADGLVALVLGLDAGPGGAGPAVLRLDGDWRAGAVTRKRDVGVDKRRQKMLSH